MIGAAQRSQAKGRRVIGPMPCSSCQHHAPALQHTQHLPWDRPTGEELPEEFASWPRLPHHQPYERRERSTNQKTSISYFFFLPGIIMISLLSISHTHMWHIFCQTTKNIIPSPKTDTLHKHTKAHTNKHHHVVCLGMDAFHHLLYSATGPLNLRPDGRRWNSKSHADLLFQITWNWRTCSILFNLMYICHFDSKLSKQSTKTLHQTQIFLLHLSLNCAVSRDVITSGWKHSAS